MKNTFKILVLLLTVAVMLTACGRYSRPSPIENSGYPHHYPSR